MSMWWRFITKMICIKHNCPEQDNEQTVRYCNLELYTAICSKSILQKIKSLIADIAVEYISGKSDSEIVDTLVISSHNVYKH
jgi:hypothetical protein